MSPSTKFNFQFQSWKISCLHKQFRHVFLYRDSRRKSSLHFSYCCTQDSYSKTMIDIIKGWGKKIWIKNKVSSVVVPSSRWVDSLLIQFSLRSHHLPTSWRMNLWIKWFVRFVVRIVNWIWINCNNFHSILTWSTKERRLSNRKNDRDRIAHASAL